MRWLTYILFSISIEYLTLSKYSPDSPSIHLFDQIEAMTDSNILGLLQDENLLKALTVQDDLRVNGTMDETGRVCIEKVILIEETEYEETLTCTHNHSKRCQVSYATTYEPHQEQKCNEIFRKNCDIEHEKVAADEVVEECRSSLIPDCEKNGPPTQCKTVYETVCNTQQNVRMVEDDVPHCKTVIEKICYTVTKGREKQN